MKAMVLFFFLNIQLGSHSLIFCWIKIHLKELLVETAIAAVIVSVVWWFNSFQMILIYIFVNNRPAIIVKDITRNAMVQSIYSTIAVALN